MLSELNGQEIAVVFVNIYNTLLLHVYMEIESFPENIWEWKYLERKAYYIIDGSAYSLWDIHNGILRGNKPYPDGNEIPFYPNDPRLVFHDKLIPDPCLLFTLSNHTM